MKKISRYVALSVTILCSGCTTLGIGDKDKFSCATVPDLDTCLPVSELYKLTETTGDPEKAAEIQKSRKHGKHEKHDETKPDSPPEPDVKNDTPRVVLPNAEQAMAIMTALKLARLWIAPWKSANKLLWMPTYAYVKAEEGEFSFGVQPQKDEHHKVFPLDVNAQSNSDPKATKNSINEASELLQLDRISEKYGQPKTQNQRY